MRKIIVKIKAVISRWSYIYKARALKRHGIKGRLKTGVALENPEYISIGSRFVGGRNLKLQTWPFFNGKSTNLQPQLLIGDNVSIMDNCQISCMDNVEIGDGCLLGENVFITDNYHGRSDEKDMLIPPTQRELISKEGGVQIGKNVWLGRNVCVMPGVRIGDGAVVGANSVVTKSIPAYSVAVGVPARVIRNHEV